MGKYDKNYTDRGYLLNYRTPKLTAPQKRRVLQFQVELLEIEPLVWRRIQIDSASNFWDLHVAIQDAMGWLDYHLHRFEIRGKGKRDEYHIGMPDFYRELHDFKEVFPGWEVPVEEHFNDLGVTAGYLYDYGDCWMHRVVLEGYIVKDEGGKYPVCLAGERSCPPEDCGGVGGYYDLLSILRDPEHEEYEETRVWAGENWSPEDFDPANVKFFDPHERWVNAFILR